MIGGAAERDGQAEPVERGQHAVEQRAIFDGELAGQPGLVGVINIEPRLHGREIGVTVAKGIERLAKLPRFGPVLRIVDHHIFAARERQRVIQRLRLGARVKLRHDHDLDISG